jgi:hypothetical protein
LSCRSLEGSGLYFLANKFEKEAMECIENLAVLDSVQV